VLGLVRVCTLFLAGLAPILSGCGTQTRPPLRFADWLSYDAVRKAAAITVIPAYNRSGFQLERLRERRGRRDHPRWLGGDRSLPQHGLGWSTFVCDRQGA